MTAPVNTDAATATAADDWLDFQQKWVAAYADFELAVRFMPAPEQRDALAFMCMGFELEQAAFGIREPMVAATKLQWWGEELGGTLPARHPLTKHLAGNSRFRAIPADAWHAVIAGALAQRESAPASRLDGLLGHYSRLHAPLASIEAILLPGIDAAASAQVLDLARAARSAGALPALLEVDQLPLPLDLLARHQLSRAELASTSVAREAALRDHFAALADRLDRVLATPAQLSLPRRTLALLVRWQCARAARASDPLQAWHAAQGRLPLALTWSAWRAARRDSVAG